VADITLTDLLDAYASGIFPMSEDRYDPEIFWVDPRRRGILPLEDFHVPRRLARTVRADPFAIKIDSDFDACVLACAEPQPERGTTWINDTIIELYTGLHRAGFAHSVECWREGALVGGLYGVALGAAFFGESMFSRATDASKVALVHLVARLKCGGFLLLDTQFVTEHLLQFGAKEIPRTEYRKLLAVAVGGKGTFSAMPGDYSGARVLQSITHTS